MIPPVRNSLIDPPLLSSSAPKPSDTIQASKFNSVSEAIEKLFFQLEACGILDRLGNLRTSFVPPVPPLDESALEKLRTLQNTLIPIHSRFEGDLLYELKQEEYVISFNQLLHKKFSASFKNLNVFTSLRGGTAEGLVNIISYIENFITNYFRSSAFKFTNQKEIEEILKYIKENHVQENKAKDIDWLDTLNLSIVPPGFQDEIQQLFIDFLADHSNGTLSTDDAKNHGFLNLTVPTKKALYPYPQNYVSSTIGKENFKVDRATGFFQYPPCLFPIDDLVLPVVINGEFQNKIIPHSHGRHAWAVFFDKLFQTVRLLPHHLHDFRASIVAIHYLTEGGNLDESRITLQEIIDHALKMASSDLSIENSLCQIIIGRFNNHTENRLSYFINLFLHFQANASEETRPCLARVWTTLKRAIFKDEACNNDCPLTQEIYSELIKQDTDLEAFSQSLFQLALLLNVSDLEKVAPNIKFKCSTAPIGTPFFKMEFDKHLIVFPTSFYYKIKTTPFIFDKFITQINPNYLLKKSIPQSFHGLVMHLMPLLNQSMHLFHQKLFVLFAIVIKQPFSTSLDPYFIQLLINLSQGQDPFPIEQLFYQSSPDLLQRLFNTIHQFSPEIAAKIKSSCNLSQVSVKTRVADDFDPNQPLQNLGAIMNCHDRKEKIQRFKKFLEKIQFSIKLSKIDPSKLLPEITECIFKGQFQTELIILKGWNGLLELVSRDFFPILHEILVSHTSEMSEVTHKECSFIFFEVFLRISIKLENKALQNYFLEQFPAFIKNLDTSLLPLYAAKFLQGIQLGLFPLNSEIILKLCHQFLENLPETCIETAQLIDLSTDVNYHQKNTQHIKTCLMICARIGSRFNHCLEAFQKQSVVSNELLTEVFKTKPLSAWTKEELFNCYSLLNQDVQFSPSAQMVLVPLFQNRNTPVITIPFVNIQTISPLNPQCLKLWIDHSQDTSQEDFFDCFSFIIENLTLFSDEAELIVIWTSLLRCMTWDNKTLLLFLKNLPLFKNILGNASLKEAFSLAYRQCIDFLLSLDSPSKKDFEECYSLRKQIGKDSHDFAFLDCLTSKRAPAEMIFDMIDSFEESSENCSQIAPYLAQTLKHPTNSLTLKDAFQEKLIRLWPDCLDFELINKMQNPEEFLKKLVTSSSSKVRGLANDFLLQNKKIKIKNSEDLSILSFKKELEDLSDVAAILEMIKQIPPRRNGKCKPLIEEHAAQLILKVKSSENFIANAKELFSLFNGLQIESSEATRPLLLELLKKCIRQDKTQVTYWIDLCINSAPFNRFPSDSSYILLLLQLFTFVKKYKASSAITNLLKHSKPILQSSLDQRLEKSKYALAYLDDVPNEVFRFFSWVLSLNTSSELELIEFFIDLYKNGFEKFPLQPLVDIALLAAKTPQALKKIAPLLTHLVTQSQTSKMATSMIPLLMDKQYPSLTLLSELLPKIKNDEKHIEIFNVLKENFPANDDQIKMCLRNVLEELFKLKMSKRVVHPLLENLSLIMKIFQTDDEQRKKFSLLYSQTVMLFKIEELDPALVTTILDFRSKFGFSDKTWTPTDLEWVKLLSDSKATELQILYLDLFYHSIKGQNSDLLFEKIRDLLNLSCLSYF